MAAAFYFSADGKFQFEYFYGAVDRMAQGTYTVIGDTLKLKSDKEAGKDFTVEKQSQKKRIYYNHKRCKPCTNKSCTLHL